MDLSFPTLSQRSQSARRRGRVGIWLAPAVLLLGVGTGCGLLDDYRVDASRLQGAACQLGEVRCNADWLLTCKPTLDGWVKSIACDTPEHCDSRSNSCRTCSVGEYRCNGMALEACNDEGSGWSTVDTCSAAAPCNLNLQACAACTPGDYQCSSGALSQCSAAGVWGPPTQCAAPELCSVSEDKKSGQCKASAACMPGQYACQDVHLVRCDAQGVIAQGIETCASAALCQQALAKAVMPGTPVECVPPSCEPKQGRCEGNQLLVCSADRTALVVAKLCTSDPPCNPKLLDCARCTPGESYCSGADLLRCDSSGVFQRAASCASPALCDAAASVCNPPECDTPGRAYCDAELPLLHQCGADRIWHNSACDTSELCDADDARCDVPLCAAEAKRCDRAELQHCNSGRTAWVTDMTCPAGTTCDPATGGCLSGTCQVGSSRCNDVFLERCTQAGWQRISQCATNALCHADTGTCEAPECAPGTFHCLGQSLQDCDERRKWHDFTTCAGQCDDIGGRCL